MKKPSHEETAEWRDMLFIDFICFDQLSAYGMTGNGEFLLAGM